MSVPDSALLDPLLFVRSFSRSGLLLLVLDASHLELFLSLHEFAYQDSPFSVFGCVRLGSFLLILDCVNLGLDIVGTIYGTTGLGIAYA